MKKNLVSLALLTVISSQAYGHKIYSEDCDDSAETAAKYEDFESEEFKLNLDSIPGEPTGILGQSGVRKIHYISNIRLFEHCYRVGLIARRPQVQILPSLPNKFELCSLENLAEIPPQFIERMYSKM